MKFIDELSRMISLSVKCATVKISLYSTIPSIGELSPVIMTCSTYAILLTFSLQTC